MEAIVTPALQVSMHPLGGGAVFLRLRCQQSRRKIGSIFGREAA
jgi:hypothetical protein